ncbi:Hpt domain-containing protein [Vibrio pelagius]|uniref:Hpt domain-containing protein n=1 Tax=Vibrio pelagius TaxID=28169 RepID=A0ABY5G3T3_VIBPE|nr:Hpt domain-containing protein [Vibrio pelagius]UTT84827.1 Hpt domain-containing protein [Vibrio pelagius]
MDLRTMTVTNTYAEDLVDESVLQQMIVDTSAEVIPILIDHYVEESKTRIEAIKQAAQSQDGKVLEFEVHTLGSTSLALGNRALSTLARDIERQCLEKQTELAFTRVDELLALADDSIEALITRKELGFD